MAKQRAKVIRADDPVARTKEERLWLFMYRQIGSRWEQRLLFLIVQSISWGSMGAGTDKMTFEQLWRSAKS